MQALGRAWLFSGTDGFQEQMGSQAVLTALLPSLALVPCCHQGVWASPRGKFLECASEKGQNVYFFSTEPGQGVSLLEPENPASGRRNQGLDAHGEWGSQAEPALSNAPWAQVTPSACEGGS